MLIYTDKDLNDFVRYVKNNYGCREFDVFKMVETELKALIEQIINRRTPKLYREMQAEALANCRAWLAEPRKQIKPDDLVSYRIAKNYFNSIQPKEAIK
jgi:hypothetical protein